ncbi:hypothetical protein EZS27_004447 [termite gut metagenome]|uniref:DUF4419 domain-containing protein n=1 Tax=termite gut metagenome TaxID=433724 RepID=A0A5J4SQB2_9ZZZZ
MKNSIFLLLLSVLWLNAFAQNAETFEIEKLSSPEDYLVQRPASWGFKTLALQSNGKKTIEKQSEFPDSLVFFAEHPVLQGFLMAYQEHRPLTISPDIIWLLINQGFARHVVNNAEALRNQFVDFEGKKELIVVVDSSTIQIGNKDSKWEVVFPQFIKQISGYTGQEITDILTSDFSTTTPTTQIVSQITIMETFKEYFDYKVIMIGCGIPKITIEGTVDDWEKVLEKTRYISKYDLKWWTNELEPVLQQIINTKKGRFNKKFWMEMIKFHTEKKYGNPKVINGWITKFFPYDKDGIRTNLKSITDISSLASEIVKVPFMCEDRIDEQHVKTYQMEFWAGFVGLSQRADFMLKPEIGWAVINKGQK